MDNYKNSAEWQALNRIWKNLSKDSQILLSDDFKLISRFIEAKNVLSESSITKQEKDNKYLSSLSQKCIDFILGNEPNTYHSMMAVLDSHNFSDCKEFIDFYFNKYKDIRPHIAKNKNFVKETAELCWQRYYKEFQYYSK